MLAIQSGRLFLSPEQKALFAVFNKFSEKNQENVVKNTCNTFSSVGEFAASCFKLHTFSLRF